VRLVGPNGEQVGIVAIGDALRLAQEADLDLVEVAPMARPPVCKLMDYGKFKYENAQKAREARRNQTNVVIKEMKLRPKIDAHDYETKKGHVVRFLKAGDKVKITIMFRGREQHRPELGFRLLQRLAGDVEELGFVESAPKQDGRNMVMVLGPHKKKSEAKADVAAERDRKAADRDADRAAEEAEHRERTAAAKSEPKKVRRRSENLDPDIDVYPHSSISNARDAPAPLRGTAPNETESRHHAEDEEPLRHQQAGQGDRLRQDRAPEGWQAPQPREEALDDDAPDDRHGRGF
jgi:translation initiation factor IF-3